MALANRNPAELLLMEMFLEMLFVDILPLLSHYKYMQRWFVAYLQQVYTQTEKKSREKKNEIIRPFSFRAPRAKE